MTESELLSKLRNALGRSGPLASPPVPPEIDEPIARLVHSDIGLPELFAKRAGENGMGISSVAVEQLADEVADWLRAQGCRSLALPDSAFLEKVGIPQALRSAGFEVRTWSELRMDDLYGIDAGVTDAWCAVAETGSLVVRSSPEHGKSISLIPPVHVAIIEPKNLVPDLVDLFEKIKVEGGGSNTVLISGPSKTADIEMNLVTGVHGPGVVRVFVLT